MNCNKTFYKRVLSFIFIFCCALGIYSIVSAKVIEKNPKFSEILNTNNITVTGNKVEMTDKQIQGFLLDINDDKICQKYERQISKNAHTVLSPEDILELHYYTLSEDDKKIFLDKTRNEKVDICMDEYGTILISYNLG